MGLGGAAAVGGMSIPTIGGRKPINSQYAGGQSPSGVAYSASGFPDFSPYAVSTVVVEGMTGVYRVDSRLANQLVGLTQTPQGFVWHHVEDGMTMQLIPKDVHVEAPHTGGAAVIRNGGIDK